MMLCTKGLQNRKALMSAMVGSVKVDPMTTSKACTLLGLLYIFDAGRIRHDEQAPARLQGSDPECGMKQARTP